MEPACWWNRHLARILPQPDNPLTFNPLTFNPLTFNLQASNFQPSTFNLQPSTK
ncbi:MAG: hypothetical protein F6J90_15390 [Moorea sp. SIOASIH]|nr:hypothetical protein [Moorena sp. SIOASIH]